MPASSGTIGFGKVYPDRLYDVGICEQHSFGFVQGLTVAGYLPVLAHYSTFAQRGYDQFFQEIVDRFDRSNEGFKGLLARIRSVLAMIVGLHVAFRHTCRMIQIVARNAATGHCKRIACIG